MIAERLKAKVKLANLWTREAFDKAWKLLGDDKVQRLFYLSAESRNRFAATFSDATPDEFFEDHWSPVALLFREESEDRPHARTVERALRWLLDMNSPQRPILVVDLSREQAKGLFWNDTIQSLVIGRLLDGLARTAETFYREGRSLNALVVVDEAHRLAPRELIGDADATRHVRGILVDAARTTRKYGLGWLFISQTLSSLHPEILQQLRIMFFGFGLSLGQEFVSLRQLVGSSGAALDLYTRFRDPHSAFDVSSR